jgi:hypothetical protein
MRMPRMKLQQRLLCGFLMDPRRSFQEGKISTIDCFVFALTTTTMMSPSLITLITSNFNLFNSNRYDIGELSPNSPVKELKSFPQDLVLVGRSSILIKGISDRLGIPWSLAKEWAPIARTVLDINAEPVIASTDKRVRFRYVMSSLKKWAKGRGGKYATRLPSPIRSRLASLLVRMEERKSRRKLTRNKRK